MLTRDLMGKADIRKADSRRNLLFTEAVGFEPTDGFPSPDFESGPL